MSDDNTQAFINARAVDPDLEADNMRFKAAQDEDEMTNWQKAKLSLAGVVGVDDLDTGVGRGMNWLMNIPKNVGIGAYRALVNTVDTVWDVAAAASSAQTDEATGETKKVKPVSLSEAHPELMKRVYGLADEWTQNNKPEDDIAQGIAQFTVPFLGWMKALGAVNGASKVAAIGKAVAAEAVTSGTAYEPHEGRMADLVQMGRQLDGRFGDVLRSVTPDGSAVNAYINYMTDRDGEGEWEGRFKNIIDNSVTSAGLGAFITTASASMKFAKYGLEEVGRPRPFASGQRGMIAFHGSPHNFDKFDMSKIGTGEGAQTYGHGLYFAESKDVANTYVNAGQYGNNTKWGFFEKDVRANLKKEFGAGNYRISKGEIHTREIGGQWRFQGYAPSAQLYHAEIPDEAIDKMLDWDKPLSEQPHIMEALNVKPSNLPNRVSGEWTGQELMSALHNGKTNLGVDPSPKAAAEFLNSKGIPGVRYFDGASRQAGKGTRNIVLFDDKLAKVVKKE